MSNKMQSKLAESSWGRMGLHLLCLIKDHHAKFHFKGIFREVKLVCLL